MEFFDRVFGKRPNNLMLSKLQALFLHPGDALSPARWALGHSTRSLTLGRKLLVTFLSLAAMAGLCGAVGLIFFERIAGSVSVLFEINSPMLIESMSLIDNADRMRSVVLDGVNHPDDSADRLQTLMKLDDEGSSHASRLMAMSARVGLWSHFEPIDQLRNDYVATLQDIIKVAAPKATADNIVSDRYTRIRKKALFADGEILRVTRRFEDTIAENNAIAKTDVREGIATSNVLGKLLFGTIATFDELQAVYQLSHATARVLDLAQAATSVVGEMDLALLESQAQQLFLTIAPLRQRLATLVQVRDPKKSLADIELSLEESQTAFLSPDGLVAKKRESLTAAARLTARLKKLSEIQIRYLDVLTGVAAAVRGGNAESMTRTASTIAQGRAVIMVVVALSALIGLAAAFFLKSSIIAPLKHLTTHVRSIREGGDLAEISDRSLVKSSDELGDLSRSFNGMIAELAETRRKLIARSEAEITKQVERLETALTNMSQGLCMFDRDKRVIVCNKQYAEMYGIDPRRIGPGTTLRKILEERVKIGSHHGNPDTYVDRRLVNFSEIAASDNLVELNDGRVVHIVHRPMSDGGWVTTHEDVTEQRRAEAKIAHMARHDALTNLPNRLLFREQIEHRLVHLSRDQIFAVLCLDLDRFKSVNDTLGHPFGDELLRQVARRMSSCLREGDTIARLGGDEFAILQGNVSQPGDTIALAARLFEAAGAPFDLDGHQVVISVSIGIAMAPTDAADPDQLLKNADMALYRAKAAGRGTYRFFETEMDTLMQARRALELDLRKALANDEFELYYQPLVNLKSEEISGFEALLRWNHPKRGLVVPLDFIPLAEETALIIPIGEWVLRQACAEAIKWPSQISIAVNLSPAQFKMGNLSQMVASALAQSGLPARRLELEITESVLLVDNDSTLATLHQLRNLGVRISMDDFGTGYSSLSYLRSFPFDKIKIDRSFVHDLASNADSKAIIRAVTGLGSSLGITTTGEGVETKEELEYLKREGCTEAQGYFFSKPRPASEIFQLLSRQLVIAKAVA
jgi:diguanylate cyclase (GGDEF)-like protein